MAKRLKLTQKRLEELFRGSTMSRRLTPKERSSSRRSSKSVRIGAREDQAMSERLPLTREYVEELCARVDAKLPPGSRPHHPQGDACGTTSLLGEAYAREERYHPQTAQDDLRCQDGKGAKRSCPSLPETQRARSRQTQRPREKRRRILHGRQKGDRIPCSLKSGDPCPECQKGKALPDRSGRDREDHGGRAPYGNILRVREAPVQPLRGGLHREPPDEGSEKYDADRRRHDRPAQVRDAAFPSTGLSSVAGRPRRPPSRIHPVGHRRKDRRPRPSRV